MGKANDHDGGTNQIEAQSLHLTTDADSERFRTDLRIDMICMIFTYTVVHIATVSAGVAYLRFTGTA